MKRQRTIPVLVCLLIIPVASAITFTEDFSANPAANGWQIFGNPNLFHWDSTNQNLRVTWDSSQTNSYFHRPLGTILTRDDDFQLGFDLTFEDYAGGVSPGKPGAFEAAIGFFNLDQAAQPNFSRGAGKNATYGARNLVEFDFFPAFGMFLPTIAQVVVGTNYTDWLFNHDNLYEMTPGETFHVAMNYAAATHTLTTLISNQAAQYGQTQTIAVDAANDFRVMTFSINSYSDQHSIDSLRAHGVVDNVILTVPPPPVENLSGGFAGANWQVQLTSRTNWIYRLERTTDFQAWAITTAPTPGNGAILTLEDTNPPTAGANYRVRAQRP